jgi:DNA modification methylase
MLTQSQRDYIMRLIQEGKDLPEEFKYQLFPKAQKEYELNYAGKMRKEDLLANEDGVFPVPLQVEKVFNGEEYEAHNDGWRNMIVFGDNLQLLKTIYENKDSLIKDKVKGKVKLIYIDPPFATTEEFKNKEGARAYNDKAKGAEFIEFIRRRLIIAKELLSYDGNIVVHLDNKKSHYIKLVLDEIFGEENFVNEIIWHKGREGGSSRSHSQSSSMPTEYQNLLIYSSKKSDRFWKPLLGPYKESTVKNIKKDDVGWYYGRGRMGRQPAEWEIEQGRGLKTYVSKDLTKTKKQVIDMITGPGAEFVAVGDVWNNKMIKFSQTTSYPTEKPEDLLKYIINASTEEGDLVLDFFSGSGTMMSVAEKLNRKWIACDFGKLSYFTMQKRILKIQESKHLNDKTNKYGKKAKSFITAQLGVYDLKKAFELEWKEYQQFVSGLFEIEKIEHNVGGLEFSGKKGDYSVKIFDYRKFKDSSVDESYLEEMHRVVNNKISGRVYIVAPANYVGFLTDYYEIDDIRYYFLKVPYQLIKELHKTPFQKLRQPQTKNGVNHYDEVVGFHFIRQPEVKSDMKIEKNTVNIILKEFRSQYRKDDKGVILENFETLSAVFIDKDYNGKSFEMDEAYFADELLLAKTENVEDIREELKEHQNKTLEISINRNEVGKQIMVVYTDIYGNDFTETFTI